MVEKVWGYNCFGVCIKLIARDKIDEYNTKHQLFNEKIVSWKVFKSLPKNKKFFKKGIDKLPKV